MYIHQNRKNNNLLKRQVNIILLVWGLFSFVGILITFQKGVRLEKKHVEIIELTEKVKSEFFQAQIFQRDFFITADTALFSPLINNLNAAEKDLEEIISISEIDIKEISSDSPESFVLRILKMQEYLTKIETVFAAWSSESRDVSQQQLNQILLEYNRHFTEFEKGLQKYLSEESLKYKKIVSVLVIGAFIILIISFAFISRLMKVLKTTERKLVERNVETEQNERNRIATDLHDGLGSLLSSIHLYIKIMEAEMKEGKDVSGHISHLRQLSDLSLQNVKAVIGNLEPMFFNKYGLIVSVEKMCQRVNKMGLIHVDFDSAKFSVKLSRSTDLVIYRIISELVNNAMKHSQAKQVKIVLENVKNKIFIHYTDDGVGIKSLDDTMNNNEKIGLKSIIYRIELLGGKYEIKSQPGGGLAINLWFWVTEWNRQE